MRYTALFSGVLYGWYHRRSLQTVYEKHKLDEAIHNREKLVADAKEAWKRMHEPSNNTSRKYPVQQKRKMSVDVHTHFRRIVVTDPDDPRFDLEKLLAAYEKNS